MNNLLEVVLPNAALQSMLRAILDNPANDGLRLVYADLLDDAGEHERSEFIRVQIRLSLPDADLVPNRDGPLLPLIRETEEVREKLRRRERELWESSQREAIIGPICGNGIGSNMFTVRRGFVEGVECRADAWIRNADAVLARQPIRKVKLTTFPDEQWVIVQIISGQAVSPIGDIHEDTAGTICRALAGKWPRIEFTLPANPEYSR